jgi:hypothetical protein
MAAFQRILGACLNEEAFRNCLLRKALGSGQGRDRTADTRIFSPLLYQLSYLTGFSKVVTAKNTRWRLGCQFGDRNFGK